MNIDDLINQVIPPSDREHRDGFTNSRIIDKLDNDEKKALEDALIVRLSIESKINPDILIIETLAYLKSQKSLNILYQLLQVNDRNSDVLSIATYIYLINKDDAMIEIAKIRFKQMDNKSDSYYVFRLVSGFYQLAKFNRPELNKIVEKYIKSKDLLLAYNSKRASTNQSKRLEGYTTDDIIEEEMENTKRLQSSFRWKLKRLCLKIFRQDRKC